MSRTDESVRSSVGDVPSDEAIADFRLACISRAIDNRELTLQKQSKVFFEISGAGHEALGLGLARMLRPGDDWFFPYYRDLSLVLGLGVTPDEVLLQAVGSAADPSSAGRQMPSHWGAASKHIVTQSSPTGSQMLGALGCAEATQYARDHPALPRVEGGSDEITYVSIGEGACAEGEVWEAIHGASSLQAPLLIVVADNGWAISVPRRDQYPAPVDQLLSSCPGLQVYTLDGWDYFEVRRVGARAIDEIRAGHGPALLHARVTRPLSHSSSDTQSKYRPADELAEEARHDPLRLFAASLVDAGLLTDDDVSAIHEEAERTVGGAADRALAAPRPDPATVTDHVVDLPVPADRSIPDAIDVTDTTGDELVTMADAINRALTDTMHGDERVRVFGEDVADASPELLGLVEGKGGVFGLTKGLQTKFGSDRCFNTPLAEASIVGRGIGQAIRGLKPCAEIQFMDYIYPAMHQIRSEAATARWRSNGATTVPLVIRAPIGGYLTGGAIWHSQCGESIFAHIPGLLLAFPSCASDAAGLLHAAFRCDDPVLFCEHKHLLRQAYARGPYPGPDHVVAFGRGAIRRAGSDLTVVTWGATVQRSLQAAERLHEAGASVEVIDLRTLVPYDRELIAESVGRTHRLLVVHEDTMSCGFGAEIAAWAGDELFGDLAAPIRRVAALDTPVPYEPTLEEVVLPQTDDVVAASEALLEWT